MSPNAGWIVALFLLEAAAQVGMAFFNKIVCWCAYHKFDKNNEVSWVVTLFAYFENWFAIDALLDLASLVTFGCSIVLIVKLFLTQ